MHTARQVFVQRSYFILYILNWFSHYRCIAVHTKQHQSILFLSRSVCQLPPEQGPCEAAINSWFYNPSSGRCEQFQFGGCDGNLNNFESRRECETACGGNDTLQDKASRHL